jgi:hypothetical protein
MDVEKTMQFILEQQARSDARFEAWNETMRTRMEASQAQFEAQKVEAEKRAAETDKRFAEAEKRFAETDKRFAETEKRLKRVDRYIVRGARGLARERGMRQEIDRQISALVVAQQNTEQTVREIGEAHVKLEEAHLKLEEAQRQTEISLKAFIDSMRKPTNGN